MYEETKNVLHEKRKLQETMIIFKHLRACMWKVGKIRWKN